MNGNFNRQLGARVARYRVEAGFSQEALAEKIGVRPITISRLERGFSQPSLKTMVAISDALGVRLPVLVNLGPPLKDSNEAIEDLLTTLVNRPEHQVRFVQKLAVIALEALDQQQPRQGRKPHA